MVIGRWSLADLKSGTFCPSTKEQPSRLPKQCAPNRVNGTAPTHQSTRNSRGQASQTPILEACLEHKHTSSSYNQTDSCRQPGQGQWPALHNRVPITVTAHHRRARTAWTGDNPGAAGPGDEGLCYWAPQDTLYIRALFQYHRCRRSN